MGSRSSQQDQDGTTWQTVGVPLGEIGLDLRQPVTPGSLTKLINARFADEKSIARREGHTGQQIVDASDYPAIGNIGTVGWVYGHGQQIDPANPAAYEQMHHPVAGQGRATFNFDGADVVWTGDRLLVLREDGNPALGQHTFWRRDNTTSTPLPRGIPAHLPVQTDFTPPDTVSGHIVECCLTSTLRVIVADDSAGKLWAWIVDRGTGAVINKTELGGVAGLDHVRIVNSGEIPLVIWRNGDSTLNTNYWTGTQWAGKTQVDTGVSAISVAPVDGGCHVAWLTGGVIYVGRYFGSHAQDTPYTFRTALSLGANTPSGAIALAVAPDGTLTIASQVVAGTAGLYVRTFTAAASGTNSTAHRLVSGFPAANTSWDSGPFQAGLTIATRGLKNQNGLYQVVVYAAHATLGAHVFELQAPANESSYTYSIQQDDHRHNTALASHAFRSGDEVFCWLRTLNANTHYLIAGVHPQVCGFADREVAPARLAFGTGIQVLSQVVSDPLSNTGVITDTFTPAGPALAPGLVTIGLQPVEVTTPVSTAFTWARLFTTGQAYQRAGNALIGDLELLPAITVVRYGKTAYISGSAVRNWDGIQLGDTGFQDYPKVVSNTPASGGSMTAGAVYFRAYAVRYNARGERFQSAAVTYGPVTVTANQKVTLTTNTLPDTNHADVQIEFYRTEAGGTTFYLDGSVANDLTAATVQYVSTQADSTLRTQPGDPFATGVGNVSEIENWGPLGCAVLAVVGDRMWACGGQIPAGFAQFSKLKEDGFGVGFDDLAELEEVNTIGDPINSIVGYGDAVLFLEKNRIDVLAGTGPDNNGVGSWGVPQMVIADGAITHYGTIVTQVGVAYWGADGPRLLTQAFRVENISIPIRTLTAQMTPSGVRVDLSRKEVIWYTEEGTAVLWNYVANNGRWAAWTGLPTAGVSDTALIEPDGWLDTPNTDVSADNGRGYEFAFRTAEMTADQLLGGATLLRQIGVVGTHNGDHSLLMRVYYNGSPLWGDSLLWSPDDKTWLMAGTDVQNSTPAQIDALGAVDQSGQYATKHRVNYTNCRTFRLECSDIKSANPTFTPYEMSMELGVRGGLGRTAVTTYAGT